MLKTDDLFKILQQLTLEVAIDQSVVATALVELTGPDPAIWIVRATGGRISLAAVGLAEETDLTVTTSSEVAIAIFEKTLNPMVAFMTGKLKIKGDLAKVALIKQLLTSSNFHLHS
ncbi:MAG: hypothetical protein AMR96_01550 [Candidatus Adiutrix intracellularis]|jgi:predicted lipid carrier protein YhbT|nr:MAG: hypothetical protein AMR96_01550 [Candidatus Adiutrix intracellularis]MDR2827309.1 SCP2 sterol-binding domain-containing protein [Candidatus Adiutrix intracellularis]